VVRSVESTQGVIARTDKGEVQARYGVLAGDALLQGIEPRIEPHVMPVASYVGATAPLPDPKAIIANDRAISDSRFVVSYFRLTPDGRLLFGGGERYTPDLPEDMAAVVMGRMTRLFPQLAETEITHAWGGLVSITNSRLPHVGKLGDLYFAHGFSGQGVILTSLLGKLMAEAIDGDPRRLDLFMGLAPMKFPGGPALRTPLYVLGMLYYALRDRL
jgi:gamma-glutamylputrescine oxidase